jgi:hypothetical protein
VLRDWPAVVGLGKERLALLLVAVYTDPAEPVGTVAVAVAVAVVELAASWHSVGVVGGSIAVHSRPPDG